MADSVFSWASQAVKSSSADADLPAFSKAVLHASAHAAPAPRQPPPGPRRPYAALVLAFMVSAVAGVVATGHLLPGGGLAGAGLFGALRHGPPRPAPRPSSSGEGRGPLAPLCAPPEPLDFVEIGCSDFDTLIQEAAAGPSPGTARGLSVDAVPVYAERLPRTLPHAHVLNRAVVGFPSEQEGASGTVPVFYTPPDVIAAHGLPIWMKGCNSVGKPHPTAEKTLAEAGLSHLMVKTLVPVATLSDLLVAAGACTLGTLKVDVEGMDAELLTAYAAFLWAHPACRAERVMFEANELSSAGELTAAKAALAVVGYTRLSTDLANVVAAYDPATDARRWAAAAAGGGGGAPGMLTPALGAAWLGGKGLPEVKAAQAPDPHACVWGRV